MSAKYDLKEYRRIIWREWQPIVGRKKLSSFEYPLIEGWFRAGVQVQHVLWAIRDCHARAEQKGRTLYSLGVIAPDLERVQRQSHRMRVGDSAPKPGVDSWRTQYIQAFEDIADLHTNPECAAMYRELARAISGLSQEEADKRYREIQSCR